MSRSVLGRLLAAVVIVAVLPGLAPAAPASALPTTLAVTGHGWGHGRGMGQWGAFGYARMGWSSAQILNHFYRLTTPGTVPDDALAVRLENLDSADLEVQSVNQVRTSATGTSTHPAVRVRKVATGWAVDSGPGCGGAWTEVATSPGTVTVTPLTDTNAPTAGRDQMVQACQPDATTRWYRGSLTATTFQGTTITVNTVALEQYLRSVVAIEIFPVWDDLGGAAALQAQAVAARSYALAENRAPGVYRTTDALRTSCCQASGGVARRVGGGGVIAQEDARIDAAVAAVAGVVRRFGGNVARTEYSASTGGMTVASTHSPAVVDAGDAVVTLRPDGSVNPAGTNPHATWNHAIPRSTIEGFWGPPGAELTAVDVTRRAGGGDFGGRATEVRLTFSSGPAVVLPVRTTGGTTGFFNRLFCNPFCTTGLHNDWFSFSDALTGPSGGIDGTWAVASDGGVFAFGAAPFTGSMGGQRVNSPMLGMAPTRSGSGYWLVAGDGGIFSFGDAVFHGSTGSFRLNAPVVGMAATPSGLGYWLVASDGGVFAFGDAQFRGSAGSFPLAEPVTAMAARPDGLGYWLVARDGGVFAFQAPFFGALPGTGEPGPAVGMVATTTGQGYLVATAGGAIVRFGDAPSLGSVRSAVPGYPGGVVGLAAHRR